MRCDHHDSNIIGIAGVLSAAVERGTLPVEALDELLGTVVMARDALKVGLMGDLDEDDEGFLAASIADVCDLIARLKHEIPALVREQN